ncbi:MAG: hypothetical protein AAF699_20800, partial [Pseudomonadota bacterium]
SLSHFLTISHSYPNRGKLTKCVLGGKRGFLLFKATVLMIQLLAIASTANALVGKRELPISVESFDSFDVFRPLDIEADMRVGGIAATAESIWIGSDFGLLEYDKRENKWWVRGIGEGLPGDQVSGPIEVDGGIVFQIRDVESSGRPKRKRYFLDLDLNQLIEIPVSSHYYWYDGLLWTIGINSIYAIDPRDPSHLRIHEIEVTDEFKYRGVGGLALAVTDEYIYFASAGQHNNETDLFEGGGVGVYDRSDGSWEVFRPGEDTFDGYSCDVVFDGAFAYAAHWHEDRGLTRFQPGNRRWSRLKESDSGDALGGRLLHNSGDSLWIGRQSGLLRYYPETNQSVQYRMEDGLPGYIVSGISSDHKATWVSAYAYSASPSGWSVGIARFHEPSASDKESISIFLTVFFLFASVCMALIARKRRSNIPAKPTGSSRIEFD